MPKRKKLPKLPDYTGIPNDNDKLVVQKSNPLQTLSETKLSLAQFKILDAYLSRIDSNKRKGFTIIALFEKAEAYQDDDGLWQVDLACTSSALEYVFNIENLGYLRYRLKNIIDLTSRYSYILYLYLENNRFRKSWKISLEELKKILNCTAESYNKYKEFNDKILKKCQQELHNKTDLRFSYQPTDKRGRSYTAVIFSYHLPIHIAIMKTSWKMSPLITAVSLLTYWAKLALMNFLPNRLELYKTSFCNLSDTMISSVLTT